MAGAVAPAPRAGRLPGVLPRNLATGPPPVCSDIALLPTFIGAVGFARCLRTQAPARGRAPCKNRTVPRSSRRKRWRLPREGRSCGLGNPARCAPRRLCKLTAKANIPSGKGKPLQRSPVRLWGQFGAGDRPASARIVNRRGPGRVNNCRRHDRAHRRGGTGWAAGGALGDGPDEAPGAGSRSCTGEASANSWGAARIRMG